MKSLKRVWVFLFAPIITMAIAGSRQDLVASEEGVPAATKNAPATHKQASIVKVANAAAGETLEDFCIDASGRIVALLGPAASNGVAFPLIGELLSDKKPPKFASEVRVYDADGALIEKWPIGFLGQAINTAPDGTILVGGDGHIARFDSHGKKLHDAESPQMTYISKNADEMRVRAKEQMESDRALYSEQVKQLEEQLKELKSAKENGTPEKVAKSDDESPLGKVGVQQLEAMIRSYKQHVQILEKQTIEDVLRQVLARARKTHSIAASDREVFVTCPAMAGYGYGVWRTDDKFGQAKEIIKTLSGCCGQMDVQCAMGELYVCENSRHRVVRFDREGKEVAQFGKRDREGEGQNFGGCCNPMNLCFNKQGNLYVSESNGVVKHFTAAGEYLGIVGVAAVQPGCKNSCVGVAADDSRLFYIDIEKSEIIVLTRDAALARNKSQEAEVKK
jgi:hypothetical protein